MADSICKLCLKQKPLIKKSHIMSDFLHKDMYDENHKLRAFDPKDLLKSKPRISKPSSGSYEGNLLCNECDNSIIGKYESYSARLINGSLKGKNKIKTNVWKSIDGITHMDISNLDYPMLKLFLLSLLWRAHISSHDEYSSVKLGPYAEKIRRALLEVNPGKDDDIIISITKLEQTAGYSTFIGQPLKHKVSNTTCYSIIINGYIIVYYLKPNRITSRINHQVLKEKGTITIMEVPRNQVAPFVMKYVGISK